MTALEALSAELDELQAAAALESGIDSEVTVVESRQRALGWGEGKPNLSNASASRGVCVRVIAGGGQGIATSTVPGRDAVRGLAKRALEAARSTGVDPHRSLPSARQTPPDVPPDAAALSRPAAEIIDRLKALEAAALASDRRIQKVVKLNYSEGHYQRGVANSRGVRAVSESTVFGFSLELLAVDGEKTEAAWDYQGHRLGRHLDLEAVVTETAEHALRSLGGTPIATGTYPVVMHPRVAAQLLDLVGEALSAEAAQLGRSFLRGLVGRRAASAVVTIVDDPALDDGVASSPFDDEGVPRARLTPINAGTLTTYFFDVRSAAREGRDSNGRGEKESLGAPPRPGPTNLFIRQGETPVESMIGSAARVFLLREVMGLHMADPITGEFSLGASGYLYEKGRFSRPVRGVTIAGTLSGVLNSIEAVGNDLRFYGSVGSPSLLVGGLTVAGN